MKTSMDWMLPLLEAMPGKVSAVCKNLVTGEKLCFQANLPLEAASLIKLYLMAAMYQGFADGSFSPCQKLRVTRQDCAPSCGVLYYLEGDRELTLRDLVELMIIVSDNTACNVLLDFYGLSRIQSYIRDRLGLTGTCFRRKMFDEEKARQGLNNLTTAADTAWLLEEIYAGRLVSASASAAMLQMLKDQRLNGKIPFLLHTLRPAPVIAHKTGEDTGTTHDAGIIVGEQPLLLCFMGNETDVPGFERMMGEAAYRLYMNPTR